MIPVGIHRLFAAEMLWPVGSTALSGARKRKGSIAENDQFVNRCRSANTMDHSLKPEMKTLPTVYLIRSEDMNLYRATGSHLLDYTAMQTDDSLRIIISERIGYHNGKFRITEPGKEKDSTMMTSRERVMRAINHKSTDRAPADYGGHQVVTDGLMRKLGVASYEELLRVLRVDMRRIVFNYGQPDTGPDADGYMRTMWGAKHRDGNHGDGQPNYISPFDENTTVDDVHAHLWPDAGTIDYSPVKGQCEKYYGEYATFGAPWSPFYHEVGWLIGQERFLTWMATKPDVAEAIIQHVVDYEVDATRRFLEAARGMVDITYFGNDFGTQRSLVISPRMWQTFFRQPLKRFYDVSHEYGCMVMQHSCGAVRDIIPSLIEDGVDILDPIQVTAAGMDLPGLVRDFGSRLCFHGGVDTQRLLPFGSPRDVRDAVRFFINLTHNRGGYILCGSQEFIEDIPLENILALYDENPCRGDALVTFFESDQV
ncbi:MAG: hypothetical protein M1457_07805 [bacterium]|nr:hypothetical protein [bacterium]